MRSARLSLALDSGVLSLPPQGTIAVVGARAGEDLSALPKDRTVIVTGLRPDFDAFSAAGWTCEVAVPAGLAGALVCLPRAREAARALVAAAAMAVRPGGPVAVDGQKTDGIETLLRDLARELPGGLSDPVSKAHGRLAVFAAGPELAGWAGQDRVIEGEFLTRPGVFSADAPDRGSVLLAGALPARLVGSVVDLGAGWGFLARAVLAREGVVSLDLVEADAVALDCARANVTDPRARFHWADAVRWRPARPVDHVVCNPPFHVGREADPALGVAFLRAAAAMLAPDGRLWLVANRHLPYDAVLADLFQTRDEIGGDGTFRVVAAARPRALPKDRRPR